MKRNALCSLLILSATLLVGCEVGDILSRRPPANDGEERTAEALPGQLQTTPPNNSSDDDRRTGSIPRALEQVLDSSSVLRDREDLRKELQAADAALNRIKSQNRSAMRQANRQMRLRGPNSPNVILLVADQLGYGDLSCYGAAEETPNIDQLANSGVRLTQYYTGSTEDNIAQWSLMTGLQPFRFESETNFVLAPGRLTLAEVFWQAGYTTSLIGDFSLGGALNPVDPGQHGFDDWYGYGSRDAAAAQHSEFVWNNGAQLRVIANADGKNAVSNHDLLIRETVEYIRRHRRGRPFLLYLAWPHPRVDATDVPGDETRPSAVQQFDQDVGRIQTELRSTGLINNSIVVITTENGPAVTTDSTGTGRLRGAVGELYEASIRVPMIIHAPGKISGAPENEQVCGAWDLLPTLAHMIGAFRQPRRIDGVSLLTWLRQGTDTPRDIFGWRTHSAGGLAARVGQWKAVRQQPDSPWELYDLDADPSERDDLAPSRPEIVADVAKRLAAAQH